MSPKDTSDVSSFLKRRMLTLLIFLHFTLKKKKSNVNYGGFFPIRAKMTCEIPSKT